MTFSCELNFLWNKFIFKCLHMRFMTNCFDLKCFRIFLCGFYFIFFCVKINLQRYKSKQTLLILIKCDYIVLWFLYILIIAKDKYFIYLKCYWKINPPLRKILWYFYEEEYEIFIFTTKFGVNNFFGSLLIYIQIRNKSG